MDGKWPAGVEVEIAVAGLSDGLAAVARRATRLELSSALAVGGLTPSLGLTRRVVAECSVPVVALLRTRPGGFEVDPTDLRVLEADAALLAGAGVEGVAFGALRNGRVDHAVCRAVLRQLGSCKAIFHRAFDRLADHAGGLDELIDLGFARVLTSGGCVTAHDGRDTIAHLMARAEGRITLVAAGGVRGDKAGDLLDRGCRQFHASCRRVSATGVMVGDEDPERVDPDQVADLVRAVHGYGAV